MISVRNLRLKGKKLGLSFEFVHDRLHLLPSYQERAQKIFASLLRILIGISVLVAGHMALPLVVDGVQRSVQKTIATVQTLLPKPLPQITVLEDLQSAQRQMQQFAQTKWQQEIQNLPLSALQIVQSIPDFFEKNQNVLFSEINLPLPKFYTWQIQHSSPFQGVALNGAAALRNFQLNFHATLSQFPLRLEIQIALLKSLENFNAVNIREYLDNSHNRAVALEEFLVYGKNLEQNSLRELYTISGKKRLYTQQKQALQLAANSKEQELLQNLQIAALQKTRHSYEDFLALRQRTLEPTAEAGLMEILEVRYTNQLRILQANLQAIEANKAILIANVQITPTPGIDLGLISQ